MTDKTGTLTEGRMVVSRLASADGDAGELSDDGTDAATHLDGVPTLGTLLETAVLCTDADADAGTGDPRGLAGDGLRLLAVARARHDDPDPDDPYRDLAFLGLVGLFDPRGPPQWTPGPSAGAPGSGS